MVISFLVNSFISKPSQLYLSNFFYANIEQVQQDRHKQQYLAYNILSFQTLPTFTSARSITVSSSPLSLSLVISLTLVVFALNTPTTHSPFKNCEIRHYVYSSLQFAQIGSPWLLNSHSTFIAKHFRHRAFML